MRRLFVGWAAFVALALPASVSAEIVSSCVGDSFVVEAPPGWVMTYTPPQYAGGWPNMFAEGMAARAAVKSIAAIDSGQLEPRSLQSYRSGSAPG